MSFSERVQNIDAILYDSDDDRDSGGRGTKRQRPNQTIEHHGKAIKDDIAQAVVDSMKCPICMFDMWGKEIMCCKKAGHTICSPCASHMSNKCPICLDSNGFVLNPFACSLAKHVRTYKCPLTAKNIGESCPHEFLTKNEALQHLHQDHQGTLRPSPKEGEVVIWKDGDERKIAFLSKRGAKVRYVTRKDDKTISTCYYPDGTVSSKKISYPFNIGGQVCFVERFEEQTRVMTTQKFIQFPCDTKFETCIRCGKKGLAQTLTTEKMCPSHLVCIPTDPPPRCLNHNASHDVGGDSMM